MKLKVVSGRAVVNSTNFCLHAYNRMMVGAGQTVECLHLPSKRGRDTESLLEGSSSPYCYGFYKLWSTARHKWFSAALH